MDEIKKMLRAIINKQSSFSEELIELKKGIGKKFNDARENAEQTEKRLTERMDKIGKSVAYLEDDAPTREEHEALEKRVAKVEHKIASL